jgi:hypothetical protein
MAKCGECGVVFSADDIGVRTPCPACGAISPVVEDAITLVTEVGDQAMLELLRGQEVIAFRESVRNGRTTWADEEGGLIATTITGTSPQNEADSPEACGILVRKMNQIGNTWNEPVEAKQDTGIDCVATDVTDQKKKLYIQVVKAIVDRKWWRDLSISETNTKSGTADELAGVILQAVKKKSERTELSQRSKLVLAIDANRLVGLTLDSVVNRVREKHGTELSALSFRSIWVVGPSTSRTHRLDIAA